MASKGDAPPSTWGAAIVPSEATVPVRERESCGGCAAVVPSLPSGFAWVQMLWSCAWCQAGAQASLFFALVLAVKGSLAAGAVALGGRSISLSVGMAPGALASGRVRLDAAVKQIMPKCK